MGGPLESAAGVTGERDLDRLISGMRPELRSGRFVFVTVPEPPGGVPAAPGSANAVAWVREDEGTTLVLDQREAERLGLTYDLVAAMITLRVHSALDAVGLTAAVAGALADAGISCNVLAGYFHDHLFVPVEQGERAMAVLRALAGAGATATPGSTGRRGEGPVEPSPSTSA